MPLVKVDGLLNFSTNNGVIIENLDDAIANPERLRRALIVASEHINDEILVDACCGGVGPLAGVGVIDFEDYVLAVQSAQ